jgi:hypothetical protein
MEQQGMSLESAVTLVREKRPPTNPNVGFLEQLRHYQQYLQEKSQFHVINKEQKSWLGFLWSTPIQKCLKHTGTCQYIQGNSFNHLIQRLALYPAIIQQKQTLSKIIQYVSRDPKRFWRYLWNGF